MTPASNLSDEDIDDIKFALRSRLVIDGDMSTEDFKQIARAIEAKVLARATAEPFAWASWIEGRPNASALLTFNKLTDEDLPLYLGGSPPTLVGQPPILGGATAEPVRMAYKTGYDEGYSDASDGLVDHDACEEGWQQYSSTLGGAASGARECLSNHDAALLGNTHRVSVNVIRSVEAALGRDLARAASGASPALDSEHQVQSGGVLPDVANARLMQFYAVTSIQALVDAQAHHIERLQAKLPPLPSLRPTFPRG